MKKYLRLAILACTGAMLCHGVLAQTTDSAAVEKAKEIRLAAEQKQQERAEETRVEKPATPPAPGAPLELTIDQTDSPGATK